MKVLLILSTRAIARPDSEGGLGEGGCLLAASLSHLLTFCKIGTGVKMRVAAALVATLAGVAAFAPSAKPGARTALSSKSQATITVRDD